MDALLGTYTPSALCECTSLQGDMTVVLPKFASTIAVGILYFIDNELVDFVREIVDIGLRDGTRTVVRLIKDISRCRKHLPYVHHYRRASRYAEGAFFSWHVEWKEMRLMNF